ncbi:MAG: PrsW family intramembrane metalloprotease [Phycisphaerales bacterium]|nr:PrsW family intramembrane metalloprotease [Phycisphaerales bacterium]
MPDPVDHRPGIEHEPVYHNTEEDRARRAVGADELGMEPARSSTVHHESADALAAVGDEPALRGMPIDHTKLTTFGDVYLTRRLCTPIRRQWSVMLVAAIASGPFAILGALWDGFGGQGGLAHIIVICAFAPLVEEMLKVAGVLYLAERRPWLVPAAWAIPVVAACSGAVFAVIENWLYLSVYLDHPSQAVIAWRWSMCTALHVGCSLIAGLGVRRMWIVTTRTLHTPTVSLASPLLITAVLIHGLYNAGAMLFTSISAPF